MSSFAEQNSTATRKTENVDECEVYGGFEKGKPDPMSPEKGPSFNVFMLVLRKGGDKSNAMKRRQYFYFQESNGQRHTPGRDIYVLK